MRLLVVLLVPAFIGMVVSQAYHPGMGNQQGNFNQRGGMRDQGRAPGGSSRGKTYPQYGQGYGQQPYGQQPYGQQGGQGTQQVHAGQQGNVNHFGQGTAPLPGGSSRGRQYGQRPYQQVHAGQQAGVNHVGQGTAPLPGGSSRGQLIPDLAPARPGPIQGAVQHSNMGNAPSPDQVGGNSGTRDIALGAVQTQTLDRVNMVGAGQVIPPGNNNPNSGEYFYDYGVGGGAAQGGAQGGGVNNAPQVHPLAGAGERTHNGAGGSSRGGNGPAFAAGPYSDKAGAGAPLGGAAMNEFNQDPAASTGAASVGGTVAGVVIAVLVLVGIVAVAAFFLVKQRNSRIALSNV